MKSILNHPILDIPKRPKKTIYFEGKAIEAEIGQTIATALHRAGYTVHSISNDGRNRSLECGIGKCGACEMLVDGKVKRICITKVDNVNEVKRKPKNFIPDIAINQQAEIKTFITDVAIIGAGPAGLAAREILNEHNVSNIVIDSNATIGGQFIMQTHQFFFFEKKQKYGGLRGFEIAKKLAGDNSNGIILNTVVWDILENNLIACKNIITDEIFYIEANYLVVATGAIPFIPAFINDDVPGVYTAAVVQKMMNIEYTLLGKRVLTVGAGNIGYLTSYQLTQAGAKVVAIIEAMDKEGGFPVQANRVRRLGIPILTSKILTKVIPNKEFTGIEAAIIADCINFEPIKGTEKIIENIDIINICTGLLPDNKLLVKGREIFGHKCFAVGDANRIGEGTTALLHGKKIAYEIIELLGKKYDYEQYLQISKEFIDSQKHPEKLLDKPLLPDAHRQQKPFVVIDCLYAFACNPCAFVCNKNAIIKETTNTIPVVDYSKCTGCMDCVYQCPGLAIFGYNIKNNLVFIPIEHFFTENRKVALVDNNGKKIGEGIIEKILHKPNKTNIARIKVTKLFDNSNFTDIRGLIYIEDYTEKPVFKDIENFENKDDKLYLCHCEDVTIDEVLKQINNRNYITIDEIKHTTRLGMGACRGQRCIRRLKQVLQKYNIELIGDATPRAPMSIQLHLSDVYSTNNKQKIVINSNNLKKLETKVLIAGGGIAGSALFRYFSEAKYKPILINHYAGSSWRNIAGGRPAFTVPEISDIAIHNLEIFEELQKIENINFKKIHYITFAHDEETYLNLQKSTQWSDAYIIEPKDFHKEISPYLNRNLKKYVAALITRNCWQATPGLVINLIRKLGLQNHGVIFENTKLISVEKIGNKFKSVIKFKNEEYYEVYSDYFVNALGYNADKFAKQLGIETGTYPVRHQAFITKNLPMLGINNDNLGMLIDRRKYKGFSAVYGQQLHETGQIIGCASPAIDPTETEKNIKLNTKDFIEVVSEIFTEWIPALSSISFQAFWSGYYIEPRYIVDPELGLFIGLRGHGFMLAQYLAKLYVDYINGKNVPSYFNRLKLSGDGLPETVFK
ncbi:MAG: FAD-dependent oxidoreductase [Bacteroidales bacterium]|nr:FAD-dependent oxidoreductase [Bacteroidales bacterium]